MSKKQEYDCPTCGRIVTQYPSQLYGSRAFCSRACYARSLINREPHNKGKRSPATKPCAHCGSSMIGVPSRIARQKFCSPECLSAAFTGDLDVILKNYTITGGCWLWQGTLRGGYGRLKRAGRQQEAHRVSYEHHIGPIPQGLVIDHLCRNRSCINPSHLEPVTFQENISRGEQGSPEAMRKHWATRRERANGTHSRIGDGAS